ncbi:hypothetical protein CesoFtcFv8_011499 [Champsocephalus esox]|uniref:Uncharacterized protein n=1 Tax=Champsocephalus esox TaxID=159716 RepID=A0AAN8C079_9TELE|nr:hypothetical protein CesoFtcFv8_011499 [Champsocephalus esox]
MKVRRHKKDTANLSDYDTVQDSVTDPAAAPKAVESLQVVHLHNNKISTVTDETFCRGNSSYYIRTNMDEVRLDRNPVVLSEHPDSFICLQALPIGWYH